LRMTRGRTYAGIGPSALTRVHVFRWPLIRFHSAAIKGRPWWKAVITGRFAESTSVPLPGAAYFLTSVRDTQRRHGDPTGAAVFDEMQHSA